MNAQDVFNADIIKMHFKIRLHVFQPRTKLMQIQGKDEDAFKMFSMHFLPNWKLCWIDSLNEKCPYSEFLWSVFS